MTTEPNNPNPAGQPDPNAQPQPSPTPTPEPTPAPTVPLARFEAVSGEKWVERRAREQAEARAAALEQQLAEAKAKLQVPSPAQGQQPPTPTPTPAPTGVPSPQEIQRLASQMAEQQTFDKQCNDSVREGRKEFADFDQAIAKLTAVAPTVDANGRPMLPIPTVQAALATGHAHRIFHHLSSDLNEADRIMSLPPMAQAVELAKLANELSAPEGGEQTEADSLAAQVQRARVSGAPAPIKPKVGAGAAPAGKEANWDTVDKDGKLVLDTESWMKKRQEEVERNRKANGTFGLRR